MIITLDRTDVPELIDIMLDLRYEAPALADCPVDAVYVSDCLIYQMNHKDAVNVGYDIDGELAGVMIGMVSSTWYSPRLEAMEMLLAVRPKFRGSSVAYRLIKEFERRSKELGAQSITVGTSLGVNDPLVIRLYERLGYRVGGTGLTKRIADV